MHKYWYNCPIKFYYLDSNHYDVLNPQNIQVYGKYNPYVLEVNTIHRVLLPKIDLSNGDYSLFVVNNGIETKIVSRINIIDETAIYISFLAKKELQGQLILKLDNAPILYSNCVSFENTTNLYGAKQLRIITRHNYNRQKFEYDYNGSYFVFNVPAYEKGVYGLDADITNERVGELSTLETTETYLDEFVKYEFDLRGNNDIALFLSSITTNTELYINGTKRTLKEAIEYDDYNMSATATFVNIKDKYGNNIYIDEIDIFFDLGINAVNFFPLIGDVKNVDEYSFADCAITVTFSDIFYMSDDIEVKVYKDGSLLFTRNKSELVVSGNILYINGLNFPNNILGVGSYYVTISDNSIFSEFGIPTNELNIPNKWYFNIVSEDKISLISFIDGTREPKQGKDTTQTVKIDSITNEFDILTKTWIVNGVDIGNSSPKEITLVDGINTIRLKVIYNSLQEILSNELVYTKTVQTPVNLIDVVRINNSSAKYIWDNNGNDFGLSGTATFQMSLDAGNTWQNLAIDYSGDSLLQNEKTITSTLLTQIVNNTNVRFRILMNGNGYIDYPSNIVNKLWEGQPTFFISDVVKSNGQCDFKLNVLNSDFNGYVCMQVDREYNCKRALGNFGVSGIFSDSINNNNLAVQIMEKQVYVTIPQGVYNCSITVNTLPNNIALDSSSRANIGFSLTPNYDNSIVYEFAIAEIFV